MRTISIYLILLLLLGSFAIPQIIAQEGSGSEPTRADYYLSPNSNVDIDLEYLVENSGGVVTREDGCYLFRDDVFIEETDKLNIPPGQVIKFLALARLTIRGTLIADGTPNNPINFTQDPEGDWPTYWPSHWQGIHLDSTSSSSIIENCIIEHAAVSLILSSGSSNTVSNTFIRSHFGGLSVHFADFDILENITMETGRGINVYGGDDILVKNCRIRSSSGYAVMLSNSNVILENCTLYGLEGMIELRYSTAKVKNTYVNPWNLSFERNSSKVYEVSGTHLDVFDINGDPVNGAHANITDRNGNIILDTVLPSQSSRWWMEIYSMVYQDKNSDKDCLDEGETGYSYPYHVQLWKDGFKYYNGSVDPDNSGYIVVYMIPELNCSTPIGPVSFKEDSGEGYALVDIMDHYNLQGPENIEIQVCHMEDETNLTCSINGTKLDFIQVNEDWNGEARFQIMVRNESDIWVKSNFFTVGVTFVQDAPQFEDIIQFDSLGGIIKISMLEDQTFMSKINASDADGDEITFTSYDIPEWITLNSGSGAILSYPLNEHVGFHFFNVTVKDSFDLSSTSMVMIEVVNVNDPPIEAQIIRPMDSGSFTENCTYNLTCSFFDEDLECLNSTDEHIYVWSSNISGFLTNGDTLPLNILTPGSHLISLEITDSNGEGVSVSNEIVILPLKVDEKKGDPDNNGGSQLLIVIVLIIAIIVLAVIIILFSIILYRSPDGNDEVEPAQEQAGSIKNTPPESINP